MVAAIDALRRSEATGESISAKISENPVKEKKMEKSKKNTQKLKWQIIQNIQITFSLIVLLFLQKYVKIRVQSEIE